MGEEAQTVHSPVLLLCLFALNSVPSRVDRIDSVVRSDEDVDREWRRLRRSMRLVEEHDVRDWPVGDGGVFPVTPRVVDTLFLSLLGRHPEIRLTQLRYNLCLGRSD